MIDLRIQWLLSVGTLLNNFPGSTMLRHLETLDLRIRRWLSQWDDMLSSTPQAQLVFCPIGRSEDDALAWLARLEQTTSAVRSLRKEFERGGSGHGHPRQGGCLVIVSQIACAC